jgi:hypothetical protein
MRNPHNAVADTMEALNMGDSVVTVVRTDPQDQRRWLIRFQSRETALIRSFMEVEVIEEDDGDATVCVLRRFNVGRRAMVRIMDALVRYLDDAPRLDQPWGQPPAAGAPRDPQH